MPLRVRCSAVRGLSSAINVVRTPTWSAAALRPVSSTVSTASRQYATAASSFSNYSIPDDYVPPTKPPTARPSHTRKAQLLRTYTSLLRSTPLMLIFQHNNLTAVEWAAIRRELRRALDEVPQQGSQEVDISANIGIQVIRTHMFDMALKITEYFDPSKVAPVQATTLTGKRVKTVYNHDLSPAAYKAVKAISKSEVEADSTAYSQLAPLMVGPLAILTFPAVSPPHLAAALKILAPSPPAFPAPSRKKNPSYYDPTAQSGLQKLLLIGGRVEGKVFDLDGVKWVGGIESGMDGLRAQLVHMLQNAGLGLTSVLEGAGKSLWLTMESRRSVMEEEEKGPQEAEKTEKTEKTES